MGTDVRKSVVSYHWPIVAWCLIVVSLGLTIFRAWFRAKYFDGSPMDGPLQILNSLDRISQGEMPGGDFPVFHGLGVTWVHYPLFALLGHNLFGSEFSFQLLSPLAWTCAMVLIAYSITGSKLVALYAGAFFAALSFISLPSEFYWFVEKLPAGLDLEVAAIAASPDTSMHIVLRWAYPIACCAAFICSFHDGNPSLKHALFVGMLFGLAPAWSYEQGLYAVAAAITVAAVYCLGGRCRRQRMIFLAVFLAAVAPVACLTFFVLSGGHGQDVFLYAFRTIPTNQGWYFGAPPNRSLAVSDSYGLACLHVYLTVLLLFIGLLLLVVITQKRHTEHASRLTLGLALLAGFALFSGASLSGYLSAHYLSPSINTLMAAGIGTGYAYTRRSPQILMIFAITVVAISITALGYAIASEWRLVHRTVDLVAHAEESEISGVRPIGRNRSLLPLIRQVESASRTSTFSTYRGLLDLATNQPHYGQADYIIHAFDDERHVRYLSTFANGDFSFVHSIRPEFTDYEEWLQTSHWDFYRVLVERYAVVEQSEFSLLWQRRPEPRELQIQNCTPMSSDEQGNWQLPAASVPMFLQLTVNYEINNSLGSIPVIGGVPRYLLEHQGFANRLAASLNPYHRSMTWLARSRRDTIRKIVPKLHSPLPGARLSVTTIVACEVRMPEDVTPAFAHLFKLQ